MPPFYSADDRAEGIKCDVPYNTVSTIEKFLSIVKTKKPSYFYRNYNLKKWTVYFFDFWDLLI